MMIEEFLKIDPNDLSNCPFCPKSKSPLIVFSKYDKEGELEYIGKKHICRFSYTQFGDYPPKGKKKNTREIAFFIRDREVFIEGGEIRSNGMMIPQLKTFEEIKRFCEKLFLL